MKTMKLITAKEALVDKTLLQAYAEQYAIQGDEEEILETVKTDAWVESIGTIGAMEIHPNEFTADEMIKEFNADNLDRMTVEMAIIINAEYCIDEMESYEIDELPAHVYYVAEHANNLF